MEEEFSELHVQDTAYNVVPQLGLGEDIVRMLRLEDIRAGKRISGISPDSAAVEVLSVEWYEDAAVRVVYRDGTGSLGEGLVYRDKEDSLELASVAPRWSFDGDGTLRLTESNGSGSMCMCTYLMQRRRTWTRPDSERSPGLARAPTCARQPAR